MILLVVLNPPIQLDRDSAYGANEYLSTSHARRCDIADALGVTVALHAGLKTLPPDVLRRWYRPNYVTPLRLQERRRSALTPRLPETDRHRRLRRGCRPFGYTQ